MFKKIKYIIFFLFIIIIEAHSGDLRVSYMLSIREQGYSFEKITKIFKKENNDINTDYDIFPPHIYKSSLENLIKNNKYDVIYWQAGQRLNDYILKDLVLPIDDIWDDELFSSTMKNLVSYEDKVYAIPYSYYQWGIYYNANLFLKYKINPPENFNELLNICRKLNVNNIFPFAIGVKDDWPAASWFDYINLRLNGLDFHNKLLSGKIAFTDRRVVNIFKYIKRLHKKKCFMPMVDKLNWKDAVHYFYRDMSAMVLAGNFMVSKFSQFEHNKFRFIRFPKIIENMPYYEEAPTDVFFIPKNAKNLENAKKFLKFIARYDIQSILNESIATIPPNKKAVVSDNYFVQSGIKTLNSAAGVSQYFDRDTKKDFSDVAVKILAEFFVNFDIKSTTTELEALRKKKFKNDL